MSNCKKQENQVKMRYIRSGTQRCQCKECETRYTLNPRKHEYPDEIKKLALKMYYSGVSERGIGKVLGMNKANVYNWIKKRKVTKKKTEKLSEHLELDELYWFIRRESKSETRENVYLITMISRKPRLTVGFDTAFDKSSDWIQKIVDSSPEADFYYTDGYIGYIDVVYPSRHIRNVHDKKDTHNVESVNADLCHYIPVLTRRSKCFARKVELITRYNRYYNKPLIKK